MILTFHIGVPDLILSPFCISAFSFFIALNTTIISSIKWIPANHMGDSSWIARSPSHISVAIWRVNQQVCVWGGGYYLTLYFPLSLNKSESIRNKAKQTHKPKEKKKSCKQYCVKVHCLLQC